MTNDKKRDEREQLRLFQSMISDFPDGVIHDSERPDFLIRNDNQTIGIELTRIIMPTTDTAIPLQAQESERQFVLDRATEIYKSRHLPPVIVHVVFNSQTQFNKNNRAGNGKLLADLIETNLPSGNGNSDFRNDYKEPSVAPDAIKFLRIARFDSFSDTLMLRADVGRIHTHFGPELQQAIDMKDNLLPDYLKCDSYWLVVVAEWSGPSSYFMLSEDMLAQPYKPRFNRVFFLSRLRAQVHELTLTNAAH